MREHASPWFRTPVVTHAPLKANDQSPYATLCGAVTLDHVGPGMPRCPDCAMAIESALSGGFGEFTERGGFVFNSRAYPRVEICGRCGGRGGDPEHNGACGECGMFLRANRIRMTTPYGMVDIHSHPMCREMEMIVSAGPVVTAYPISADGAAFEDVSDALRAESLAGRVVDFATVSRRALARFLRQTEHFRAYAV